MVVFVGVEGKGVGGDEVFIGVAVLRHGVRGGRCARWCWGLAGRGGWE